MSMTIVSKIIPREMIHVLKKYTSVIQPCGTSTLSGELKYHPDIICSQLETTLYMCTDCIPEGMTAVHVDEIKDGYPNDCILNNLITDRYIITGKKTMLPYSDLGKKKVVRVAQGYVKCSVIDLGGRYITSDKSIASALNELGYEVLLTYNDGIKLNGFGCGFIGGATAVIDNKLFVFGNIENHRDHNSITEFALKTVNDIICLGDGNIYDYGGAVTLVCDSNNNRLYA